MKKIVFLSLLLISLAATLSARPQGIPEIDPGSISAASALVCVGLMMIRGRRKR